MSVWKKEDTANGWGKPMWANASSGNTGSRYYNDTVYGISAGEIQNVTTGIISGVAHKGWVYYEVGRGPVTGVLITNPGVGINSNGFLVVAGGGASGVNVGFSIANSQNTMQAFSSNSNWNVVNSIVVNNGGTATCNGVGVRVGHDGYSAQVNAAFTLVLGGRGGRKQSEVLVAMESITGDSAVDNTHFLGV